MNGVERGARVSFTAWRDGKTGRDFTGTERGTVLDRGPEPGEWWVWVGRTDQHGAVVVHARAMTQETDGARR